MCSWRTALCISGMAWLAGATAAQPPSVTAAQPPSAFELLEQVRDSYADLESYSDLGELETTIGPTDGGRTTLSFFETAATQAGHFYWRSHGETENGFEERVTWNDSQGAFVYSSLHRQYKPIPSLASELAHTLGPGTMDALVVPLLLSGTPDALADPPAAVVDGIEPCGDAQCWTLSLTRMAGAVESVLRIDQQTLFIREVTVRLAGDGTPVTIRVRHHPSTESRSAFTPPEGVPRVTEWQPLPPPSEASDGELLPSSVFGEEITVALLSVVTRIVDSRGVPILGLEPGDLIAEVGQTEMPIRNLEWSSSSRPVAATDPAPARRDASFDIGEAQAAPGRLVVFFLQVDLEPTRIAGHLKILPDVERLLQGLHADDRVAIVSFDSHLKVWQDFAPDHTETFEVLERAVSYGTPLARRSRGVSLLEHLDPREAKKAATPEKALRLTAEALQPLPGEKDVIFLGWGLGRYGVGGVRMTAEYRPTVRALEDARATVFVLDVSQADYHSLEVGLQNVAAHTGGTYDRTFHFASQAVDRLARTIGGHYIVTIDRAAVPRARGRLTLRLRDRDGRVLFKPLTL